MRKYLTSSIHNSPCQHVGVVACQVDGLPKPQLTLVRLVAGIVCLEGSLELSHIRHLDVFWMLDNFNPKGICSPQASLKDVTTPLTKSVDRQLYRAVCYTLLLIQLPTTHAV